MEYKQRRLNRKDSLVIAETTRTGSVWEGDGLSAKQQIIHPLDD